MSKHWRVIARHDWVSGAIITESVSVDDDQVRRFTATIHGYQNWRIWKGKVGSDWPHVLATIMSAVVGIRERIVACDNTVFDEEQAW